VIRAIAIVVIEPWLGTTGASYRILACPSAPEHEGRTFAARHDTHARVGRHVLVKFSPDDQFAQEETL
jgi:hypothetical protein